MPLPGRTDCGKPASAIAEAVPALASRLTLSIRLPRLLIACELPSTRLLRSPIPCVFRSTAWFVAYSCEPLIASVLSALIRPAATLVTVRSASLSPTLTVLVGLAPANWYVWPPTVPLAVTTAAAVTEPAPSATLLASVARALRPSARALSPVALAS
ncbi:hypothetical protein D3C81_1171910 [compost metagenome]